MTPELSLIGAVAPTNDVDQVKEAVFDTIRPQAQGKGAFASLVPLDDTGEQDGHGDDVRPIRDSVGPDLGVPIVSRPLPDDRADGVKRTMSRATSEGGDFWPGESHPALRSPLIRDTDTPPDSSDPRTDPDTRPEARMTEGRTRQRVAGVVDGVAGRAGISAEFDRMPVNPRPDPKSKAWRDAQGIGRTGLVSGSDAVLRAETIDGILASGSPELVRVVALPVDPRSSRSRDDFLETGLGQTGFSGHGEAIAPRFGGSPVMAAHNPAVARGVAVQVAQAATGQPGTPIEITLDPAELGKVKLTLEVNEKGLNVQVIADRPETIDLMRRNALMLQQEFAKLGYRGIDLTFSHGGNQMSRGNNPQDRDWTAFEESGDIEYSSHDTLVPGNRLVLLDGLDLRL